MFCKEHYHQFVQSLWMFPLTLKRETATAMFSSRSLPSVPVSLSQVPAPVCQGFIHCVCGEVAGALSFSQHRSLPSTGPEPGAQDTTVNFHHQELCPRGGHRMKASSPSGFVECRVIQFLLLFWGFLFLFLHLPPPPPAQA